MSKLFLGFDTSCYRTSVGVVDEDERVFQSRRLLDVPLGERGIRQSEGVFKHITQIDSIFEEALRGIDTRQISAVAASTRPRDRDDSYMPVFSVGTSVARVVARALDVPFYETSHQQGHVKAAQLGSGLSDNCFLAIHLSGGTTELLKVEDGLNISLLTGSSDIAAGQLIDRVGVKLGLKFPSGEYLEELAKRGSPKGLLPLASNDLGVSFSGAEAQAFRLIESNMPREEVAAEVFSYVERALFKLIEFGVNQTGLKKVLISGGVASSLLLRQNLLNRIQKRRLKVKVYWGSPQLSGDNAVGVALIAKDKYFNK